jgi:hypothetical protein
MNMGEFKNYHFEVFLKYIIPLPSRPYPIVFPALVTVPSN